MSTNAKPSIVPTMLSARTALWSLVYVVTFLVLWWIYTTHGKLVTAREALKRQPPTQVETPFFATELPAGWAEYSVTNGTLLAYRRSGSEKPVLCISAERNRAYAYRALDMNPAVAMRAVEGIMESYGGFGGNVEDTLMCVGSECITVKPGIDAGRFLFVNRHGEVNMLVFFAGDIRYLVWGLWSADDAEAREEFANYSRHIFEDFTLPEVREAIDRPTVHSGHFTTEGNEAAYEQIGREMALWRLFADRAETEPDAALLPALQHFREALRILSSIRQERTVLASEDFVKYEKLLKLRRADVDEWFVILEKLVSMRDWKGARKQAKWIIKHATLTGERLDVRRATDILNNRIPSADESAN